MFIRALNTNTVLAIESDSNIRATIGHALKREGMLVIEAPDARSALHLAREHRPDVIILDTSLSDMTGMELCSRLRTMPFVNRTPILFLSFNQSAQYAAQILDAGGDDFLRKPFAARELNARVRALLRRSPGKKSVALPSLHLDGENYSVVVDNRRVELTPTEYSLLEYLCIHPDDHHTASSLLEKIWRYPAGGGDKALVRNHIRNLRRKIEIDPDHPVIIVSLHGRGYAINARLI
jgi:two-component system, OmpR family, response regulator MtrA